MAAQWGQADAAAYLIKVGADFRIFDRHDDSALHWAAYKGNVEIVGLLHHLGLPLDDADGYGQTPLHLASLRGNLGVCEYLLVDAVVATKTRLDPIDKNQKRPVPRAARSSLVSYLVSLLISLFVCLFVCLLFVVFCLLLVS